MRTLCRHSRPSWLSYVVLIYLDLRSIEGTYPADLNDPYPLVTPLLLKMDWEGLRAELKEYGQEHLLQHLGLLDESQKVSLYADIKSVDLKKMSKLWREAETSMTDNGTMKDSRLKPLDSSIVGSTAKDRGNVSRWSDIGEGEMASCTCGLPAFALRDSAGGNAPPLES